VRGEATDIEEAVEIETLSREPAIGAVSSEQKPIESLTDDQVAAVHIALRLLAGLDTDYAVRLSPRQAAAGKKIVLRYRNTQLPAELVRRILGTE